MVGFFTQRRVVVSAIAVFLVLAGSTQSVYQEGERG